MQSLTKSYSYLFTDPSINEEFYSAFEYTELGHTISAVE